MTRGVNRSAKSVVRPSLNEWSIERAAHHHCATRPCGGDLAPTDSEKEISRRAAEYLAGDVRLVWVIHLEERPSAAYHQGREPVEIRANGVLDGGEVLPGFSWRAGGDTGLTEQQPSSQGTHPGAT